MSILVTGAAGFIGSNLCHYLTSLRHKVVGLDNFSVGSNWNNLNGLDSFYFSLEVGDISQMSPQKFQYVLMRHDVQAVIHLAAATHVDRSISFDEEFYRTNVIGTSNLLRACMDRGKRIRIFVNQCSDEVYGSIAKPFEAYEDDVFNPTSPYAASKAAQYYVGMSYWKTYRFPVVSTFPSNTFGPRQWPEKLIPRAALRVLRDEPIPLMKSSENRRDWLYIQDHCEALYLIMNRGGYGESYNFGGGSSLTNKEVVDTILAWNGKGSIETIPDRPGHDTRYAVNSDKIKSLGWSPSKSVHLHLLDTLDWYRANMKQYERVWA